MGPGSPSSPAAPERLAQGMRLIVRKERPHPGAQLRITDVDGMRTRASRPTPQTGRSPNSSSVTGSGRGRGPRTGSGPPGPPACATCPCTTPPRTGSGRRSSRSRSTCWPGCPCSPSPAWPDSGKPRRLQLRLFSAAAQLITTGRRGILRLAQRWPWTRGSPPPSNDSRSCRPRLTSTSPPFRRQHHPPRAVEPGAHPTRQPGSWPAHHQLRKEKASTDSVDGLPRKSQG